MTHLWYCSTSGAISNYFDFWPACPEIFNVQKIRACELTEECVYIPQRHTVASYINHVDSHSEPSVIVQKGKKKVNFMDFITGSRQCLFTVVAGFHVVFK